jgi:hypothetical protein
MTKITRKKGTRRRSGRSDWILEIAGVKLNVQEVMYFGGGIWFGSGVCIMLSRALFSFAPWVFTEPIIFFVAPGVVLMVMGLVTSMSLVTNSDVDEIKTEAKTNGKDEL